MTGVGGVDRLLDRSPSHAATLISRGRSGLVRHAGVWHDPQDSKAVLVYTYIDITSALSHNTNCISAALQRLVFLRLSRPQWLPDPPIGLLYADQLACLTQTCTPSPGAPTTGTPVQNGGTTSLPRRETGMQHVQY